MMDPTDTGSYSTDEISKKSPERSPCGETLNQLKTCADCGTTKTPLWRGGPAGPKSLCNACGIRSRKKRRALLGLNKEDKDKKPKKNNSNTSTVTTSDGGSSTSSSDGNKLGNSMKRKLVCLGKQVVLQRPRSSMFNKRRKLGEEEQAAMLLMALSCGSVFA